MNTHIQHLLTRRNRHIVLLSILCVASSFGVGIQTAGEVQPISLIEAGSIEQPGDVDGNGVVDIQDVIIILEVAQGYETVTTMQLNADPNRDGTLTVDDALNVLNQLRIQ